ncbi:MAG: HNH endonuclease [Actinobacteria bacterium]|nr:HNH endonuclease [Actinomycetota bacterium]
MPAVDCDLDHTVAWSEGGPTAVHNLAPLCRHDHRLRHEAGWSHRPLGGGDHEWTSPLGRRYTTSGRSP